MLETADQFIVPLVNSKLDEDNPEGTDGVIILTETALEVALHPAGVVTVNV